MTSGRRRVTPLYSSAASDVYKRQVSNVSKVIGITVTQVTDRVARRSTTTAHRSLWVNQMCCGTAVSVASAPPPSRFEESSSPTCDDREQIGMGLGRGLGDTPFGDDGTDEVMRRHIEGRVEAPDPRRGRPRPTEATHFVLAAPLDAAV